MDNSEELLIFKNIVYSILMWAMCIVSCACIGIHIIDDSFHWWDIPPLVLIGSRSVTYLWGAGQYHRILKQVQDINRGGQLK